MLSFSMLAVGNVPQVLHFSPKRTLTRTAEPKGGLSKKGTKQKEEVVSNTDYVRVPTPICSQYVIKISCPTYILRNENT